MSIQRILLRNFRSVARCELELGRLTYLVGQNGAGKSNLLDALRLVKDALDTSLDHALSVRGGINEVRRKSGGHPTHFGIQLHLDLPDGRPAVYGFQVGALKAQGHEVQREFCRVGAKGAGPSFDVADDGKGDAVVASSEVPFPRVTSERLALVAASGVQAFAPVFDELTRIGIYNLSPKIVREPQKPQDGRLLQSAGENLVSVIAQLERTQPDVMEKVQEYLHKIVPSVDSVKRLPVGPFETLQFLQDVQGAKNPWKFPALNMSDGTLRALGVLVALFQHDAARTPSLVGIEEPETALHPGAAAVLRAALEEASRQTQVVVTSHSPELLDDPGISADQLRAVRDVDGVTDVAPVDAASREMLKKGLFSAGELLRMNQLQLDPIAVKAQQRQRDLFHT